MSLHCTATEPPPHVLIFPFPVQGHVNSMLHLAELLCLSNIHVTVLLSDHTHSRLLRHASLDSRFASYPSFRVATISDGLPDDHPRVGEFAITDMVVSLLKVGGVELRRLMERTNGLSEDGTRRRVSCVITDGVFSFIMPMAEEMGFSYVYFRTISACAFWAYFCIQEIIDAGEIPLRGKDEDKQTFCKREEMDLIVKSVPGMDEIVRRRDLPSLLRVDDINDSFLQTFKTETRLSAKAPGFILNTFEDLEGPVLDQIRKHIPNLYSLGPLHAHLKARLEENGVESLNRSSSLWDENRTCISWLDSQPAKSVIYVNFGSITILTKDEQLEFWHGLVNSGQRFLWVIRPDTIIDNLDTVPAELDKGTKARGCMVEWVPQQEVLAHPAVGAFFTHSGWNSVLECITIGVPMLCWAYFADQTTNSRFVSEVWKMGLDIKDTCDRIIVEKNVRDIMGVRRHEFLERAQHMAKLARKAVSEAGSSYCNLNRLVEYLKTTV